MMLTSRKVRRAALGSFGAGWLLLPHAQASASGIRVNGRDASMHGSRAPAPTDGFYILTKIFTKKEGAWTLNETIPTGTC
jgi:hypothetical protein